MRSRRGEKFRGEKQFGVQDFTGDFTGDVPREVEPPCGIEHFSEARIRLLHHRQTQANS